MSGPNPPLRPWEIVAAKKLMTIAGVLLALALFVVAGKVFYDRSPWIQGLLPSPGRNVQGRRVLAGLGLSSLRRKGGRMERQTLSAISCVEALP